MKAFEVLEQGHICCLLNQETILNPYTKTRELLAKVIKDNNGTVEYLSDCFRDAERQTDVRIVMVRLEKKAEKRKFDFDFESIDTEKYHQLNEGTLKNEIMTNDIIGNMIIQYDKLKDVFVEHLKVQEGLNYYSQGLLSSKYAGIGSIVAKISADTKQGKYNKFCDLMKNDLWQIVIRKMGMERYMTEGVRKNFNEFINNQGAMDFTKENVRNLIKTLLLNKDTILESAIQDVFDIFTMYYKENRCYVEGWKTNDRWKVNRKIILPGAIRYGEYTNIEHLRKFGDRMKLDWSTQSRYMDIDKVLCYISGKTYEDIYGLMDSLENKLNHLGTIRTGDKFDNTGESEFFTYKFWRKGTLHLEFKDEWLWKEFNMRACNGKNWLPESEKRAWEKSKQEPQKTA